MGALCPHCQLPGYLRGSLIHQVVTPLPKQLFPPHDVPGELDSVVIVPLITRQTDSLAPPRPVSGWVCQAGTVNLVASSVVGMSRGGRGVCGAVRRLPW